MSNHEIQVTEKLDTIIGLLREQKRVLKVYDDRDIAQVELIKNLREQVSRIPQPVGCICPPGANTTCRGISCPRNLTLGLEGHYGHS